MNNAFKDNNATPADGATLLSSLKIGYGSGTASQFALFTSEYERISAELNRHGREAANDAWNLLRSRAEDDPSPENLRALAGNSRESIAQKHENAFAQISAVRYAQLAKAKPLVLKIRDTALAAIDAELIKNENDNRARFDRLGVQYNAAEDMLLKSIHRLRDIVFRSLAGEGSHREPASIVGLLGNIGK